MPQVEKSHRHKELPPAEPMFAKVGIMDGPVQKVWPDQLTGRRLSLCLPRSDISPNLQGSDLL